MSCIQTVKVKQQCAEQIKKGNLLLGEQDFINLGEWSEGQVIHLVDKANNFLAKALLGKQNKGIGWIFTQSQSENLDQKFFYKVLNKAKIQREKMSINSNAYRFFNGEGDGLGGVTIDIYDKVAIFSWYNQGIYQYAQEFVVAFQAVVADSVAIYEKCRFKGAKHESAWVCGEQREQVIIQENGIKFATYMNEGLMTGIFLDQRDVRNYLQQHTQGQSLLNTFSYTGAFSLAAAYGQAEHTVSVDVANRSLEKTQEHFALNNIAMQNHQLYVMDVFDYLKYAHKKQLSFDWVVLDPPSFARTKKRTFSVTKNYSELLRDAIAVTKNNGRIVISTNASNFPLNQFEKMIAQTFKQANRQYKVEKIFRLPKDFVTVDSMPESNYLKVYIVRMQ